jgi:hypothetical protein
MEDHSPKSGILPQYAHLKGIQENLPVIRQLLGLSKYGQFGDKGAIGRAVQRFIENDSQNVVCESGIDKQSTTE